MHPCSSRCCKETRGQNWRYEKKCRTLIQTARTWCRSGRVAKFFSNLQLWQLVTLQQVDLQIPTVPLWKDLNLLNKLIFNWEDWKDFQYKLCFVKVTSFTLGLSYRRVYFFWAPIATRGALGNSIFLLLRMHSQISKEALAFKPCITLTLK